MGGFALRKALGEDLMIVDCGYINDNIAQERANKLRRQGIGKKNFSIEMSGRLIVNIPKSKQGLVLKALPLKKGENYAYTTYYWDDKKGYMEIGSEQRRMP